MDNLTTNSTSIASTAREQRKILPHPGTCFGRRYSFRKQIDNAMKNNASSQRATIFVCLLGDEVSGRLRVKLSVQHQGKYDNFSVADDRYSILSEHHHKEFVIFKTIEACIPQKILAFVWRSSNKLWKREKVRLLWILFQKLAVISVLLSLNNQRSNIAQAYGTQY